MFIAGLLIGPALAVGLADFVFDSTRVSSRWVLVGIAALLLVFLVIPTFPAELKFGILIGLPVGLLLAAPRNMGIGGPVTHDTESRR